MQVIFHDKTKDLATFLKISAMASLLSTLYLCAMKKQQRNILQKWKDKNIRFLDERLQLLDTIKEMVRLEIKKLLPNSKRDEEQSRQAPTDTRESEQTKEENNTLMI